MQERRREKKIKTAAQKVSQLAALLKLRRKKHTHEEVNIMAAEMRAMLDQLMGAERDVPLDERVNRKKLFTVRILLLFNIFNYAFFSERIDDLKCWC